MMYKVKQITLRRKHDDRPDEFYTLNVDVETSNLKKYKEDMIEKYQATSIDLTYSETSCSTI